jgi:uncharacterized protein (DUF2384 family)
MSTNATEERAKEAAHRASARVREAWGRVRMQTAMDLFRKERALVSWLRRDAEMIGAEALDDLAERLENLSERRTR